MTSPIATHQLGKDFIDWINDGLADGTLLVNTRQSVLHVVPEGVLLVSPRIFQRFDPERWRAVQREFLRLKVTEPAKGPVRIHQYSVLNNDERHTGKQVNGLLVPEQKASGVFPSLAGAALSYTLRAKVNADAWVLCQMRVGRATYTITKHVQ